MAQLPEEFLEGVHVRVGQDWGNQFAFLVVRSADAHVPLEFPFPALCIPGAPGHVPVPAGRVFVAAGAEVLSSNPGCVLAGNVVALYFYPNYSDYREIPIFLASYGNANKPSALP